jgi:hypothetical protein
MRRYLLVPLLALVALVGLAAPAAQAATAPVVHATRTLTNDCNGTPVLLTVRTATMQQPTAADGSVTFEVRGMVTATNTVTGQRVTLPENYATTYFQGGGGSVTGQAYLDLASLFTFQWLYYYVGHVSVALSAGGYSVGGSGDRTTDICALLGAQAQG